MSILSPKPPKWMAWLILILIGLLIVAIFKGCQQHKLLASKDARIDTLQRINKYNDSISKDNKRQYDGVLEYQNGLLALRDNQLTASNDSVDKLNGTITSLFKRYRPVTPSVDTSVTTVDNSFINDCADCFDLLDKSKRLTMKLRGDQDNLSIAYKNKINTQESRIKQLGQEKDQLRSTLTSALEVAQKNQDKYQPRRKLLLSLGTMAIDQYLPNAIGGGIAYQDKKSKIYSFKYYGSSFGAIKQFEIYLPLSLRK